MILNTDKFEAICQELNRVVPIKWVANGSIRRAYVETLQSPITLGCDRTKEFYKLIKEHGFTAIESIPSGYGIAFTLISLNNSRENYDTNFSY